MAAFKKLVVASAVVITGGSAALMFSKDSSPLSFWRRSSDDPFATHVERRVGGATWQPTPQLPMATASIPQSSGSPADPVYHQSLRPVGSLLPPIDGVSGTSTAAALPPTSSGPSSFESEGGAGQASFAAAEHYHTVEDGDTLTSLAVRYLGRADGYRQIYEFNRDVLRSPDLLPIGVVIKIPPRSAATGMPTYAAPTTSPTGMTPWAAEASAPMVPVPPRPLLP